MKQRERDREGKQVNANRKQELALINRKVSTDSDKCATFHDFSLGTFEDSLYFRALNVGQTVLQHKLCYASTIICDVVKLCPSCQYSWTKWHKYSFKIVIFGRCRDGEFWYLVIQNHILKFWFGDPKSPSNQIFLISGVIVNPNIFSKDVQRRCRCIVLKSWFWGRCRDSDFWSDCQVFENTRS